MDLHLLQRRPDEWRAKHIGVVRGKALAGEAKPAVSLHALAKTEDEAANGKRGPDERDEIDDLFATVDKKVKKSKKNKE